MIPLVFMTLLLLLPKNCKTQKLNPSITNGKTKMVTNTIVKSHSRTVIELYEDEISRNGNKRELTEYIFPNGKIVGGKEATRNRYSYFVSLANKDGHHICGGSLVSPDVVLSAAHCAYLLEGGIVQIGRHNLADKTEEIETFNIAKLFIHQDFNRAKGVHNDVMLVRLSGKSSYPLITLNGDGNKLSPGDSLTVIGWGSTAENRPGTHRLREVELKFVPNEVCKEAQGSFIHRDSYARYTDLIGDDELCATDIDENGNVQDSCYGDSGGPLIIKGEHRYQDIQVGVVSWGLECGNPNFPGVYSRISHQISWIKQNTCDISSFSPQDYNKQSFKCAPIPTFQRPIRYLTFITFQIQLDEYPNEIGWSLAELSHGRELLIEECPQGHYAGRKNALVEEIISVTPGKSYKFSISDAYGDGVNVYGDNTFLYQGPTNAGFLLEKWTGNWGTKQEKIFTVPELKTPTAPPTAPPTTKPSNKLYTDELSHQITLKIKLNGRPRDFSWELRSKNGIKLYSSSEDYTTPYEIITRLILVKPGLGYKLTIFDKNGDEINTIGSSVIFYDGKIGQGKILQKFSGKWGKSKTKIFWVPKYITKRYFGQKCSANYHCKSGRCSWGKCRKKI